MLRRVLGTVLGAGPMLLGVTAAAQEITVPSGQPISLIELRQDAVAAQTWLRFRFLAPQISRDTGSVSFAEAQGDIEALCASLALPHVKALGARPDQIIISLSDRPVPFGQAAPEATQYFEAFSIKGDACQVESS